MCYNMLIKYLKATAPARKDHSMKKVLVILNSHAGKMKSRNGLYNIVDALCADGWRVTVQTTQYRGHASELAASSASDGYELIVCCGGDGTLNEVINGLMSTGSPVPLGYVPAGSTNDFASSMGIPLDIKKAVRNIIESRPVPIDIGQFNDRYFSYIASFGAFTATSYSTPQNVKNNLGHFAYLLEGIKDLGSLTKYRMTLKTEDLVEDEEYIFGAVSNSTSVGGVVKLDSDIVDMRDGLFEVVMIKFPKNVIDLNKIVNGIIASDYSSEVFTFLKTSHIEFEMEKIVPWTLDGEFEKGAAHIVIDNRHEAVNLCK